MSSRKPIAGWSRLVLSVWLGIGVLVTNALSTISGISSNYLVKPTSYFYANKLNLTKRMTYNYEPVRVFRESQLPNLTPGFNITTSNILRDYDSQLPKIKAEIDRTVGDYYTQVGAREQASIYYARATENDPQYDWYDYMRMGIDDLSEGNLNSALSRLQQALGSSGVDQDTRNAIYLVIALIYAGQDNQSDAITYYGRYLQSSSDAEANAIVKTYLAQSLASTGREDDALQETKEAAAYLADHMTDDNKEDYAIALFMRGALIHERALKTGEMSLFDQALRDYDQSIGVCPISEAYTNRGYIYYHQKNMIPESQSDFQGAIRLNPLNPTAWYNKACWEALQQQPNLAVRDLTRAVLLQWDQLADARADADFDNIRDRDDYRALIATSGPVELLRTTLKRLGYDTNPGMEDEMSGALKSLQSDKKLQVTGEFDDLTAEWIINNM
jgi:tetratricopeptide (TPR) repeat protein